ncbi:MAG: ankyrin repeat domain-containing protein [Chloroflexota bacterium]
METTDKFCTAITDGDVQTVRQLVAETPALVNSKRGDGLSVILLATYNGHKEIAALLIEHGARLTLFEAAAAGALDSVTAHLAADPKLVNAYAPDGFQPLGLAAFFGHKPIVELLLSLGAEVNSASENSQQVMPLHSAVAHQHLEIAVLLLDAGADVNAKQRDDFTPLMGAAHNGQLEMVKLLLSYGANPAVKKPDGQSAYAIALEAGHPAVAQLLAV